MMAGNPAFLRGRDGAPSTLLTASLYLASSLSLLLVDDRGGIAVFCCADAVLLSALLLRPVRRWAPPILGCALAVLAANLLTGRSLAVSLAFAVGNMVTPVLAAALLRGIAGDAAPRTDAPRPIARLVVIAGMLAPAAGAAVGATTLGAAFGYPFHAAWIGWFTTEAAGILLGTPLLLMLWRDELGQWLRRCDRRRLALAALLTLAVAGGSFLAFRDGFAPLLFLPAVLVIVNAFMIGRAGAAISVLAVAVIGSSFADQPSTQLTLVSGDPRLQILFLQAYLAVVLLIALPVAASLEQSEALRAALVASEARYRAMAENSADLITWVDPEGICRYASPAAREMLGLAPDEVTGLSVGTLIHAEDVALIRAHHQRSLQSAGATETITYRAHHRDGRVVWMEAKTRAMQDDAGRLLGVQWTIRDVTAHKSIEATLSEAANSDALTGLANRRAFYSLLDIAITRARAGGHPLSLAVIDIDHFKQVNDAWGHEVGDSALQLMARACHRAIRGDDVLARLGGEEFALLMPGTDIEAGLSVCERLRGAVADLAIPTGDGETIAITLSAGLSQLGPEDDATALVRTADRALYAAKHEGRDRVQVAARDMPPLRRGG